MDIEKQTEPVEGGPVDLGPIFAKLMAIVRDFEIRISGVEKNVGKLAQLAEHYQISLRAFALGAQGRDAVVEALRVSVDGQGGQLLAAWRGLRQLSELIAGPAGPALPTAEEMAKYRDEVSDLERLFRRDDVKGGDCHEPGV